MIRSLFAALVLLLALLLPLATNAVPSLIGETVDLQYINYGTFGDFAASTFYSATVSDGIEFTDVVEPEIVDVGVSSITISQSCASTPCDPASDGAVFGPN